MPREHPHAPELDAPPLVRYGLPEYTLGQSPAAGAAFSSAVDGAFHERLVSVYFRLVTDGNAANRQPYLEYLDGAGNRFAIHGADVTQSASSTNDWLFSAFLDAAAWPVDDTILLPLAPILLPPTFSWRVAVDNVQAGDQISRVRFVRERFYSGSSG